jgi:transcription antitermination factor NusG
MNYRNEQVKIESSRLISNPIYIQLDQVSNPAWYVIHTMPNHEFLAEKLLLKKSYDIFMPRLSIPSRRKDRKKIIEVPLFRSYCFINTNLCPKDYCEIVKTPGVARILGIKGRFFPIPQETIESIKVTLGSGRPYSSYDSLPVGARVRVCEGPLEGVIGVISRKREKNRRLVISVNLMNIAVAVELENEAVEAYQ